MWCSAVVLLATVAVGSSLYPHYVFPQVAYTSPDLHTRQGVKYDCPHEGFFVNPANCTQFYRCVDYTGYGQYFSVYAFECQRYHVFMMDGDNSTCIPGTECIGSQQTAVHVPDPTEEKPSGTTSETVVVTIPVSGGSSTAEPVTKAPVTSAPETTFAPISTAPTTPPTVPPPPPPPVTPVVSNPPSVGECHGQYVQHEMFCNVYYKCSNSGDKFLCPAGSVFDADRQMCRIQSVGEDLCGGKSIYSLPVSFRYVTGFNSATPQQIFQVPQSQPQYLNYFNPHVPQVVNSNQQTPLHYVPALTNQFIQAGVPQPAAMVHPQQYYVPVDSQLNANVALPQPNAENVHPRMHYRVQPEPQMVHPRQYYVAIDSELNSDELY